MEAKEVLISDLAKIAVNPEEIRDETTERYWRRMQYTAGEIDGQMLLAAEKTQSQELILDPGLTGWYRIYLGDIPMSLGGNPGGYSNTQNKLYIRLDDQPLFTVIDGDNLPKPIQWKPYECAEERYWMSADLTGRRIILHKPVLHPAKAPAVSSLAWMRFVPMTAQEAADYRAYTRPRKALHIHYDEDLDAAEEPTDLGALVRLSRLEEVDAAICSYEISNTDPFDSPTHRLSYLASDAVTDRFALRAAAAVETLHKADIKALAAFRMSIANFGMPEAVCLPVAFARDNPQFYCRDRLGNVVKICSYAYREVQDYTISQFKAALQYGFDGISMLFHRGNFIGFEQPVRERFARRWPGVDPCRLPVSDSRLHSVWCEIMTEFVARMKQELTAFAGRKLIIHTIVETNPASAKNFGIDVEEWARCGLIDSFCHEVMETSEDLTGCLAPDGLIDLDRYRKAMTERPVVVRDYNNTVLEKALEGAKQYQKIADTYGVDFYGVVLNNPFTRRYIESRDAMRALGVTHFSLFNYTHLMPDPTQFHIVSKLGHEQLREEDAKPHFFRTLSIDDRFFGTFEPNWRG